MDLYISSPIGLHGVVLNWLSTGTTLPLIRLNKIKIFYIGLLSRGTLSRKYEH
jgi:hypothetical protein